MKLITMPLVRDSDGNCGLDLWSGRYWWNWMQLCCFVKIAHVWPLISCEKKDIIIDTMCNSRIEFPLKKEGM